MYSPEPENVEKKQKRNALIVDKEGVIGKPLAQNLSEHIATVLVSKTKPPADSTIIHIPFSEVIPAIPDGLYSYIVYIFDIKSKDLLDPLMKKGALDKANFFIVVPYEQVPLLSEYLSNKEVYGHVIVVGDLFGYEDGELDAWLYESKKTKKVVLSNMGLNSWYPIYFKDAISALADICLSTHHTGKQIYLLAPTHPITQITLAHALQKADPLLRVDFSGTGEQVFSSLPEGTHVLGGYDALSKITIYYQSLPINKQTEKISFSLFSTPINHSSQKKKKGNAIFFILYTLITFLFMPALLTVLTAITGKWLLFSGIADIKQGNFQTAKQKIAAASSDISLSQFFSQVVGQELSLAGKGNQLASLNRQLSLASVAVGTLQEGITVGINMQSVITGKSQRPVEDTKTAVNALKATLIMLQKLEAEDLPKEYKETLHGLNTYAPFLETITDELPQLVGAGDEKKYLVLFQNNTELRPGGGFIGSYGVLQLSHGRFKDFTIHDVYDADGQLKGHVEPPFAIRRYLPLVHLYLRDSNFDVDFVKSAQKAAFMLQAETGDKVDGVMAIDLSYVQSLISALGSVYVPGYNETVTKDNFFLLTEQHAEKNSFPGSTQKKDFLSSLSFALKEKLQTKGIPYEKLLTSLLNGIDEKHVLFAIQNPVGQESFSVNGLSSALLDTREKVDGILNDFIGINEANIGVDKVNYYIKRSLDQKVLVTDKGEVKESVILSYTNTSDGTWPGGDYKNYLRFILPKNATLDSVAINGIDQKIIPAVTDPQIYEAPYFVAPKGLEVERADENEKSIYGFLVNIPVKSSVQVAISYTLAEAVNTNQSLPKYSLQLFKQPGIDILPYTLEVAYPRGYSLLTANPKVSSTNSVVSFTQNIVKDMLLEVDFKQ